MALSGSKTINVSAHWQLKLSWTATQDIDNNKSTITANLYWIAKDRYGAVYSSATKDGYITIDGTRTNFTSTAGLSANQTRKVGTAKKTVTHDSDGTFSCTITGSFSPEVQLNSWVGTVSTSLTATLNTIPRASKISSSVNFTAGDNLKIEVSRASSSFKHIARVYVGGTQVYATPSGSKFGTSVTASLDHKTVFTKLNGGATASVEVQLDTYNGSTKINTSTVSKGGTVTAPTASTTSFGGDFNIGDTLSGTITRKNSSFTHTIQLVFGSSTFTLLNQGSGTSWSYSTSSIASSLYALTPNSNTLSGYIRITTYYKGVVVRSYKQSSIKAKVTNSNPTFSATGITYKDANKTTVGITGNDQSIIQGVSKLYVEIPVASRALPKNSATVTKYTAVVNGVTKTANWSDTSIVSFTFDSVDSSSNVTMTIKAEDSRGNSTTISKSITMIPYSPPVALATADRLNDFEKSTTITLKGSISGLNIGGTNKNALQTVQYQFKEATAGAYGTAVNFAYTMSGTNYTATNVVRDFDNVKAWDILITVKDKLTTTTVPLSISVGQPIFFIDSTKKSIGFNDFPVYENEFRFNGRIVFGSNQWASNSQGEGAGAMFLNNSDITGVNGIFMNDISNNSGEGILFLKSGKQEASMSTADYDNFYIRDGKMYMNNKSSFNIDQIKLGNSKNVKEGDYGLHLSNSDIIGLNALHFNDEADSDHEGLQFPKTSTSDPTDPSQCDALRGYRGDLLWKKNKVLHEGDIQIQAGVVGITSVDGKVVSISVKYPTEFSGTPTVQVTPHTSVPNNVKGVGVSDITSKGFTLYMYRVGSAINTNMSWLAVYGGSR